MPESYKQLKVWQKSCMLYLAAYQITPEFPEEEKFGLIPRIRESAVSIPSNIEKGYGRKSAPDYIRYLYTSYDANCDLETQLNRSRNLGYIEKTEFMRLTIRIQEIKRILKALIKSQENRLRKRRKLRDRRVEIRGRRSDVRGQANRSNRKN